MKIILLENGDSYDYAVEGLYRISDEAYSQINSLRSEITSYQQAAAKLPVIEGTSISSWGGGPLPKSKPLSEEEKRIRELRFQLRKRMHERYTSIRQVIQLGEPVSYETVD